LPFSSDLQWLSLYAARSEKNTNRLQSQPLFIYPGAMSVAGFLFDLEKKANDIKL